MFRVFVPVRNIAKQHTQQSKVCIRSSLVVNIEATISNTKFTLLILYIVPVRNIAKQHTQQNKVCILSRLVVNIVTTFSNIN